MVVIGVSNTAVGRCETRIGNDPYLKDLKKIADCTTNVKKDQIASSYIGWSVLEGCSKLSEELDELLEVDMDEKREVSEQFGDLLHGLDRILKAKTSYLNDFGKLVTDPLRKKINQSGNAFHGRADDKSKKSKKKGADKKKRKRKGGDDDNDQEDRPITVVDLEMEDLVQDFYAEMDNVNTRRRIKREKPDDNGEETHQKKQGKHNRKRKANNEEEKEEEVQVQEQWEMESRLQTNNLPNNLMIDAPVLPIQDIANDFGEGDFDGQGFADFIMGMTDNVERNDDARLHASIEQARNEDNMIPFLSGLDCAGPGVTLDPQLSLNQEFNNLDVATTDIANENKNERSKRNAGLQQSLEEPADPLHQELNNLNKTTDNTENRVDKPPNDPFDLNFNVEENVIDNVQPVRDHVTPVRQNQTEHPRNDEVTEDNNQRAGTLEDSFNLQSLHGSQQLKKKRREKPRLTIDEKTEYSKEEMIRINGTLKAFRPQIVEPDVRNKSLQDIKEKEERKKLVQKISCNSLRTGRHHGRSLTAFLQDIHNPDFFVPTIFDFSQSQDISQQARPRRKRLPEELELSHNFEPEPEVNLQNSTVPAENQEELQRLDTVRRSKRSKLSNITDVLPADPTPVLPSADEEIDLPDILPDTPTNNLVQETLLNNVDISVDMPSRRLRSDTTFFLCSPLQGLPIGGDSPLFDFGSTSPHLEIPSLPVSPVQGIRLPSMYGSLSPLSQSLPSSPRFKLPQWFKNINQGNDDELPNSQNLYDRFPRLKQLATILDTTYFHSLFSPSETSKGIALLAFEFMLVLHDKQSIRIQQENSYGRIRITPLNRDMEL